MEHGLAGQSWQILVSVWPSMLSGGGLAALGVVAGLGIAGYERLLFVRAVEGWIDLVVLPLIRARSWWCRVTVIFLNNTSILAVLVALGGWSTGAASMGAAGMGLSLGAALRVLARKTSTSWPVARHSDRAKETTVRVGVVLNLLEPPAIIVAIGLAIGGAHVASTTSGEIWAAFGIWVAVPLLIAACGEALWLGIYVPRQPSCEPP